MTSLSALTFMRLVLLHLHYGTHVRLSGQNATFAGRVEIFSYGVWGRVVHSWRSVPKWGHREASVVCRQLGFPRAITALSYSSFGEGSGPALMFNVQCTGREKTLQQCQYVDDSDMIKSEIGDGRGHGVGVICKKHDSDPDVSDIPIRLQGSSNPKAGRVEVLYAGIWGAISSVFWDKNAATVVCRQLGYLAGAELVLEGVYGPVRGPVWLTHLQCSGNETNLMNCSYDVIGNKSELMSPSGKVASVICKDGSSQNGNV
ncbi:neurotrypsin-like [Oculina patagonica]